jgi:hypothetical protein
MKFEFVCLPDLPKLAWIARLRKSEPLVRVLHGPRMELRENCFFEGAWDGPFEAFRFDRAQMAFGSGARIEDGHVVFCGPSHMGERFQSVRLGDALFVSNSLAFLLALSGERLDPDYLHYYRDFFDFRRIGIKVKQKRLRLRGPRTVELHDACNLRVDPDLTATRLEKPWAPAPRDFADYRSLLERTLRAVVANAAHAERRWRYRPVTMLSQGYDTTAVSTLASQAGCREAVTYRRSGSAAGPTDDSGAAIAACLGLHVTEYERAEFKEHPGFRADEFYIDPTGVDRHITVMQEQLAGALLLQGRGADNLWPRRGRMRWGFLSDSGSPLLQNPPTVHLGGLAMGEFRRRVGFIDFPLGSTGAIHGPAIHAIGQSKEMRPWALGKQYDKPIPRRIAEEAGVPRHLFGQTKKGGPPRVVEFRWSLVGRVRDRVSHWAPWLITALRPLVYRFRPDWRDDALAVQRCMDGAIERYVTALGQIESVPSGASVAATTGRPN